MSIQLAMVGVMVQDMPRALQFYRRLGLEIPPEADTQRFVMHRMRSGVTLFFDTVFFNDNDPERVHPPSGTYRTILEFYAGTREKVDALYAELTGYGYASRKAPWKSVGPYAAIVEDPDGTPILITAEDENADI